MSTVKLKYPIGKFTKPSAIDAETLTTWILSIEQIPKKFRDISQGLSEEQLNKIYRPEGWNVRQVIHHTPDSHLNAYVRCKWALTEDTPSIKAYNEVLWAETFDSQHGPIEMSLNLLESVHERWVFLLKNLEEEELDRDYYHPTDKETVSIRELIGRYAWHGEHHYAHIQQALNNNF